MTRLVVRPSARRDLADIWFYTADRWGVEKADEYIRRIESDVGRALDFPRSGSPATGLPEGYRKIRSGSHRIIYRSEGSDLIVVRVIHEREDAPDDIEDFQ